MKRLNVIKAIGIPFMVQASCAIAQVDAVGVEPLPETEEVAQHDEIWNRQAHRDFVEWAKIDSSTKLTGDFNGDGLQDIAMTGHSDWSTLPVALSNGDGRFKVSNRPHTHFVEWSKVSGAVKLAGDFNGDGLQDIAMTGGSTWTTLPLALSNGDGTFEVTNHVSADFASWAQARGVEKLTGDFNGDGLQDIALTGNPNWTTLPVAFSNGDGTFNVVNRRLDNFAQWSKRSGVVKLTGDFNGDGLQDIALTGNRNWATLPVALSNGDGTFDVTNRPAAEFAGWASDSGVEILTGDYNGDGLQDIALVGNSRLNSVPVAFSNGDGSFTITNSPSRSFAGWARQSSRVVKLTGDFNGDGLQDIALTGPAGWSTLPIAFSSGDGTFIVTNHPLPGFSDWAEALGVVKLTGDFNGDGLQDIALLGHRTWSTLPVAFSNGDGTFKVINR